MLNFLTILNYFTILNESKKCLGRNIALYKMTVLLRKFDVETPVKHWYFDVRFLENMVIFIKKSISYHFLRVAEEQKDGGWRRR